MADDDFITEREAKINSAKLDLAIAAMDCNLAEIRVVENSYGEKASIQFPNIRSPSPNDPEYIPTEAVTSAFHRLCQAVTADELYKYETANVNDELPHFEVPVYNRAHLQEISRLAAEAIRQPLPSILSEAEEQGVRGELNDLLQRNWKSAIRSEDMKEVKRLVVGDAMQSNVKALRLVAMLEKFGEINSKLVLKYIDGDEQQDRLIEITPERGNLERFEKLRTQALDTKPEPGDWGSRVTPPSPSPDPPRLR